MPGKVVRFEIPDDNVERAKTFCMKAFGWEIAQVPGMQYQYGGHFTIKPAGNAQSPAP